MPRYRIYVSKDSYKFSAAHMTVFGDGSKERLHGHNFQVSVSLELKDVSMKAFLDFGQIKGVLKRICDAWDERFLLAEKSPWLEGINLTEQEVEFRLCGKRYVLPRDEVVLLPLENIVVETLSSELAARLLVELRRSVDLSNVSEIEVEVSESSGQGGRTTLSV